MFQVASTFDAASSGNEVLLLKNNWNDRFTWCHRSCNSPQKWALKIP
jgi:hypothetical protein